MAGPNPLQTLGPLNRLRGALLFTDDTYNITAPFLGRDAISVAFEGDLTQMLPQMASMVQSQEVYLKARITAAVVKTTSLAALFKNKIENDANMGQITFQPDTSVLPPYLFYNCSIENVDGLNASGGSAVMTLVFAGTYFVNANLWNLVS